MAKSNKKNKKAPPAVEIMDMCVAQFPPAAYVLIADEFKPGSYSVMQTFGQIASAYAFAAVLRGYADVKVIEMRANN